MFLTVGVLSASPAVAGVFPYEVHSQTLDNGVEVHVVPMNTPGVAAFGTWMAVGSRDEVDPGRSGFAHFFEHLMFLGTPEVSADQRERALLRMAADDNAWTWLDETVYHTLLPSDALPELIAIEGDRFAHLELTPDDVRREAGAVYGEFRKGSTSPGTATRVALWGTAFSVHPYGHSTIGYEADIADMPTAHEYASVFAARHYRPDKATVWVVGDVVPAEILPLVQASYGGWTPRQAESPSVPAEPPQESPRRQVIRWPGDTSPRLAMGWKIGAADPDASLTAKLDLLDGVLLSDIGPLHRRLVVEEGLALSVWGGRGDFVDPSLFTVQALLKPGVDPAVAEAIVLEEIAGVQRGVEAEQVDAVREHTRYAFLSALDDPMTVLESLGWASRRGGIEALDLFFGHFDAVTPELVAQTARTVLVDSGRTTVHLVPAPADEEAR